MPRQWGLLVCVVLRPLRAAQHSPRLSSPHGYPSTHLGTAGEADWRFVGIEECSSNWRVLSLGGEEGFCIARPVISMPWLPVNKFTVLTIEDPNTIDSELVDAPSLISWVPTLLCKPKWERRLPKLLSISALDMWGTSLLLPVEIGTMDTSELHSVKALLDSRATRSFIDRDFVYLKGINTQTLSRWRGQKGLLAWHKLKMWYQVPIVY